jgi:transposase
MSAEEKVTQLEAEKADLQRQLATALERITELEEKLRAVEESVIGQLEKAQSQIEELKGRLDKNSHTSHKPPSSDGLRRKSHSRRKPSGRTRGGQSGHTGETRALAEKADEIITHRPDHCEQCGESLQETQGQVVERRQEHDLPEIRLRVTEHRVEQVCCPHCQWISQGSFPPEVKAQVQYGPQVRAWAVYLNQYQLIPMQRTCQLMSEGLGCSISQGTLCNWIKEASEKLAETYEKIKQGLLAAWLIHADETGIHIGKMLHWLHTACTRFLTYLQWHQKRGRVAMDEMGILPKFQGRVMRDRLSSYDLYDCWQSICGSHLLRDSAGIAQYTGQQWAARMEEALETMNKVAHFWRSRGATSVPKPLRDYWVAQYFDILAAGYAAQPPPAIPLETTPKRKGPPKQTPAKNLLDALLDRADQVLAFLDDLSIPFTNNQAERDLRMAKVQQKISGTFRSQDGATCFCRIRSYLSTMGKQGHAMLEALVAVFNGHPLPVAWSF